MSHEPLEKITIEHIESLIDSEDYVVTDKHIVCNLQVGDAVVVGISYCFDLNKPNIELGKKSARVFAIAELFKQEAYHQKRLRQTT